MGLGEVVWVETRSREEVPDSMGGHGQNARGGERLAILSHAFGDAVDVLMR